MTETGYYDWIAVWACMGLVFLIATGFVVEVLVDWFRKLQNYLQGENS